MPDGSLMSANDPFIQKAIAEAVQKRDANPSPAATSAVAAEAQEERALEDARVQSHGNPGLAASSGMQLLLQHGAKK